MKTPTASGVAPGLTTLYIAGPTILAPEDSPSDGSPVYIRVALAEFDSDAATATFAAAPTDITPWTWQVEVSMGESYETATDAGAGVAVSRATVHNADGPRQIGYRAVRQLDRHVVVVELLGDEGYLIVPESSATWLMEVQTACLQSLPAPCAPVPLADFDAALEFGVPPSATPDGATPVATPPAAPGAATIVREGFG